jgi:hypothetical protein
MGRKPIERAVGDAEHSQVFFFGLALVALVVLGFAVFGAG